MQLHQLKPKHKERGKRRIGRGGKKGTFSGRGSKGQQSRAGRKMPPMIRELIKRYPKLRGHNASGPKTLIVCVNLDILEKQFKNSDTINPKALVEKRIARNINGKTPRVKILLGREKFSKKLIFENCLFSVKAKEAVEKAGGEVK
jgi:large subunit ribosomal protein L15